MAAATLDWKDLGAVDLDGVSAVFDLRRRDDGKLADRRKAKDRDERACQHAPRVGQRRRGPADTRQAKGRGELGHRAEIRHVAGTKLRTGKRCAGGWEGLALN